MTHERASEFPIKFTYRADGQVECRNVFGLSFYFQAEPPASQPAAQVPHHTPMRGRRAVQAR